MSNLSELLPAGAGAKSADFVASGTLGSGVTVALNSDGTVKAIASDANPQAIGTPVVFESASAAFSSTTYDLANNKIVIAYRDAGNSDYGTAVVGTVSGTSISFGTPVVFESASSLYISCTYDSINEKVVIAYRDAGNADAGTAIVGTVSGTSVSFGSNVQFTSANLDYPSPVYDSVNGKIVIVYQNGSVSDYGYYVVGTVSGTSISFGSEAAFNSVFSSYLGATYDPTSGSVIVGYGDFTNNDSMVIAGAVSGTSVSWGTAVAHDTVNPSFVTNLTDFIGITDQAIADTATGAVIVQGGVSEKLSGLTVGADYYVQADGSISSPTAPAPYDIVGSTYVQSFSIAAQETTPNGITFNPSGTKMFSIGSASKDVDEYALSTAFDVSTAVFTQGFNVSAQTLSPSDVVFSTDGTKMYLSDGFNSGILQYALSTGFDVSTASYTQNFATTATGENDPRAVAFNADGTTMFIVGVQSDSVIEYALSTAYDISTASLVDSFSVSAQDINPNALTFNADGTQMFIVGYTSNAVFKYTLSTGFDVSTASYSGVSFSLAAQDTFTTGIDFNVDGTKMFIVGTQNDSVYQYSLNGLTSTVPAGRALSSTSILLEG
jgi:hypothetical protein